MGAWAYSGCTSGFAATHSSASALDRRFIVVSLDNRARLSIPMRLWALGHDPATAEGGAALALAAWSPCAIYCPAGERQYTVFIPMCILAGVRGNWTAHFAVVAIPFGVN
jgi:hypothetical protein